MDSQPFFRVGLGAITTDLKHLAELFAQLPTGLPAMFCVGTPHPIDWVIQELQPHTAIPLRAWKPGEAMVPGVGVVVAIHLDDPHGQPPTLGLDDWLQALGKDGGDRTLAILWADRSLGQNPEAVGQRGLAAIRAAGGISLVIPPPNSEATPHPAHTPLAIAHTITTLTTCTLDLPQTKDLPQASLLSSPATTPSLSPLPHSDPAPQPSYPDWANALHSKYLGLEYLYQNAPIGMAIVDANLCYVRVNDRLAQIHGNASNEGYIGQRVGDMVPGLYDKISAFYKQVLATGDPLLNLEVRYPSSTQPELEHTLLASYYPIDTEVGNRMVGITVVDVTELRRAEDTLAMANRQLANRVAASEIRFRNVAANIPGALFRYVLQPDGSSQVRYVSPGCYDLWEVDASVVMDNAQVLWDMVHPMDLPRMQASVMESAKTLIPWSFEWRIQTPSGREKWLQGRGRPERTAEGVVMWDTVILDVSDRKQTELALHESAEFLRCIYDNTQFGIFVVRVAEDGTFWAIGHNPYHAQTIGISSAAVQGKSLTELLPPETAEAVIANYQRCIAAGTSITYEELLAFLGPPSWWLTSLTPIRDDTGRIHQIIGTTTDISHLKETQQRLQLLTDNTPGVLYRYAIYPDGSDKMLYVSSGCQDLWELEAVEILQDVGQTWAMVDPEDLAAMQASVQVSAQTLAPWKWQWRIRLPSGQQRWLEAASRPFRQPDGSIVWDGLILDVSDRKQQEEDLRRNAAKLQDSQRVAQVGTWEFEPLHGSLQWSPEIFGMFGRDPATPSPSLPELLELIHPADRGWLQTLWERAIATAAPCILENLRIFHRDGSIRYLEARGEARTNAAGQVVGLFGTALDVTHRKLIEESLQEREAFFRSLFDQAGVGIALLDLEGRYTRVNDRYCEILGYGADELLDRRFMEFTEPADLERNLAVMQPMLTGVTPSFSLEKRYVCKNGDRIWVNVTGSLLYDKWEQPSNILAIVQDISDRKRTETAFKLSEERFRTVFENAAVGITIEFPPAYTLEFSNPTFQNLLGYSLAELAQLNYEDISVAEDIAKQALPIAECLSGQRDSYQLEKRYVCKDGSIIWVNMHTSVIRDNDGTIQFFTSIVEDITERRQALDLEITRNRVLREAIFEESTDALFLVDQVTRLTLDCNQRAVEQFEVASKAELIGIEGQRFQQQPYSPDELADIRHDTETKGFWSSEVEYLTRKGRSFWGRLAVKPIQVGDRPMYLVQVTDISDRKQVELDMLRNMAELQRLSQIKDDFLSTVSHELRTPLTSIDMASRMLRISLEQGHILAAPSGQTPPAAPLQPLEAAITEKISRYLSILQEQCQQERDLINDLLDLQRLNADAYELELTQISLPTWLDPITQNIHDRTTELEQVFEVQFEATLPPLITDADVLRRILSELLNNACKYTPDGELIRLTVGLQTPTDATAQSTIQFRICNWGVDIAPEEQALIFEPFYRAVKGDRWSKRGTGLGLTLVKKFTHRLQGSIQVESCANTTCFVLTFPTILSNPEPLSTDQLIA